MSSTTKEMRKASIRASIASGDGGGIDLANCDTATREILKDFDFDNNGYISKEEVTLGATLYQKSLKKNEQFKTMISCLILGYFIFCLTIGGLTYGIVKANEQVRVDPLTGITTTTGGDGAVMKTAPALVVRKDISVHNVTIADLNALEQIVFFDGTISFNVMGFARKEDETVLLVQGGSLRFNMDGLFNHTGVEPALFFDHFSDGDRKLSWEMPVLVQMGSTFPKIDNVYTPGVPGVLV
jgi:hypothetical protein